MRFLWENTAFTIRSTAAVPWQKFTQLPTPSDKGGPGWSGKGDDLSSVPSRWESLFWAPSPMQGRIKPYSVTQAHTRTRRRQELCCTCKVWGPGSGVCLSIRLCRGAGAGLREVEQPPESSVCWCWGRGGVPADAVLIYSQAANINQIFLCSVINVNHKTRKVLRSQ